MSASRTTAPRLYTRRWLAIRWAFVVVVLKSCFYFIGTDAQATEGRLQVAVSIPPQQYFLAQIAHDKVDTLVLLDHGADPHTYEPRPHQMQSLASATLFFSAGLVIETNWKSDLLNVRKDIRWIAPLEASRPDNHYWLSPRKVMQQVSIMTESLRAADPANAAFYAENSTKFMTRLEALDQEFSALFSNLGGHDTLLVSHPAWDDFATDYGLQQLVIEREGKHPTVKHMATIIRQAKKLGVEAVFADHGHGMEYATTIAESIGAKVVLLMPVSHNWLEDLRADAHSIREGLR